MNTNRRPFVGGNWKMHTDRASAMALARAVAEGAPRHTRGRIDLAVFPPFVWLDAIGAALRETGTDVRLGAQDVYPEPEGAFTGEISIPMLRDLGVAAALVGHSERRHVIGETDELIRRTTLAVLDASLHCVLCVGETLDQRRAGQTDAITTRQTTSALQNVAPEQTSSLTIAYEPVWAIGTGQTATPDDAQAAHANLRRVLADLFSPETAQQVRIIYGGSVKPGNADELFAQPDVDGGLIGGASLKPDDFLAITAAAAEHTAQPQGTLQR